MAALAQGQGSITAVGLTSSNQVRVRIEPLLTNPDVLLLQSADSPLGPWWKEPEFQRNPAPNGYDFLAPLKAYYSQRFYRFGLFGPALPYIRFIAPKDYVAPGASVSLLGANFAPVPADNTVRFESLSQSWTAAVTQAGTNFLVATVPTNLPASTSGTGTLYRVTVTTSQGTGNGVGCNVLKGGNNFSLRPAKAFIKLPPGTGRNTLLVGGGVPPYHLVPQSTNELKVAVATLTGPVLEVVAATNTTGGSITVRVEDSQASPWQANSTVSVWSWRFAPPFSSTFHTLLAGAAPGLTMTARSDSLQIETIEVQLQNLGLEVNRLVPGQIVGLLKIFYTTTPYGFQHLTITDVAAGRAKFDVVSLADGGMTTVAQGELIESPPTVVIHILNMNPGSLAPTTFDQQLVFADNIFRLPAGVGQKFSVIANFTSVSAREDKYLPLRSSVTNTFTTTGLTAGAPRLDRLLPVHGEVGRNVRLLGVGFGATPAENAITFAGVGGTRVPAEIVPQTNGELVVTVPRDAVNGPVRLTVGGNTGNDFQFYVRFHPETVLVFESITNNLPAAPRLIHQQPTEPYGSEGEEVPIQSIRCTLAGGHIVVSNLTANQQVGAVTQVTLEDGTRRTFPILYRGQEPQPPGRHLFEVLYSVSTESKLAYARLHYSEAADGSGVLLEVNAGWLGFWAGVMWDYQFTAPIYRPPAGAGSEVALRVETISQQWTSVPGSEMRVIKDSLQPVK
jgi:hypothetical protein